MNRPEQQSDNIVHQPYFVDADALVIPVLKVLQQDGSLYAEAAMPEIDKTLALKIYDTMVFTRVLDERMVASQRQGRISFYMTCKGEEASIIGSAAGLSDHDMIMAQYREQGALAFRGFSLENFMNQMFSNAKDLGKVGKCRFIMVQKN